MTKKHFIAFANALKASKPEGKYTPYATLVTLSPSETQSAVIDNARWNTWKDLVQTVATVCASSNGRFSRSTFYGFIGDMD